MEYPCQPSLRSVRYAVAAFAALAFAGGAECSPLAERLSFFRFLEDYSSITPQERETDWFASIKKIPLGPQDVYLTVGGDYRFRYEKFDNAAFGLTPVGDYRQTLQRFMVHGDLHIGDGVRVFTQLSAFSEEGHPLGSGPFDESQVDVQQSFVDIGQPGAILRVGRQEMVLGSGKLTDIREGPNQRQSFDAARLMLSFSGATGLDVFYAQDVQPDESAWSDSSRGATKFWGIYAAQFAHAWQGAALDAYYYGMDRPDALYLGGEGSEERHSFGTRITGGSGPFLYEYEGIYQTGTYNGLDIEAWGVRTEHYVTVEQLPFAPRFGLIANATSGDDDAGDGTLGTFDALFPNPAYTTDASIFRPRNLYELHPVISFDITETFNLLIEANFLWRVETGDAVYAVPGFPLVPAGASDGRYIGAVFDAIATWRPSPFVTFQASFVHAAAGDVIKAAGGDDINYGLFQTMVKF